MESVRTRRDQVPRLNITSYFYPTPKSDIE